MTTKGSGSATECSRPDPDATALRTATQLAQAQARIRALEAALQEILDEAHGDFDRDVILTAARGALVEGKMQNQYYGPNDDPEPDDGCGDGGVVVP